MQFIETKLQGAFEVVSEPRTDVRGYFSRTFCEREFQECGLVYHFVQCSISSNAHRGTLRGLHYQTGPNPETKLARCIRGSVFDVIVDLRPDSKTYLKWHGVELTEKNHKAVYIPAGFAHGFQTLSDQSEMFYQIDQYFEPDMARGVRWNDPTLGIDWPISNPILSERDQQLSLIEK